MLVAPEFKDLDLPVHDADAPVATGYDLKDGKLQAFAKDYTAPTFLRTIAINLKNLSHAPKSTAELLKKTDQELETVAELCGALVAEHEWGLYPVKGRGHDYRGYLPASQGLGGIIKLPRDHILVAEVGVIQPADKGMDTVALRMAARDGIDQYYAEGNGTYQLCDMRTGYTPRIDQLVIGTPVSKPDEQATYLVDIEPRFALTR